VAIFAAGLIGGLIALLAGYGLFAGELRSGEAASEAASARIAAVEQALDAASQRLAALEARPAPAADTDKRLDALDTRAAALQSSLDALGQRLDKAEAAVAAMPPAAPKSLAETGKILDELMQRVDALESAEAASEGSDTPAIIGDRVSALETQTAVLSGRLDALSDQMQALAARPDKGADSARAARAVAIGTLRQAAGKGGSFGADLAMVEALSADPAIVGELRPLAEKGAPSAAELAAAFPAVVDAILASDVAGQDGGLIDRLIAHARGLVTVRPVGPIPGQAPAAIASRMQAAVERGDFAAALKEREALPPAAEAVSAAWASAAADRVAIDRLVEQLVTSLGAVPKAD
jgi:hypothetical protein